MVMYITLMVQFNAGVHKVGQLRHPPTGGGSAPTLTSAEEIIAATMEGHPVVEGIVGGIDSDGQF
ncbi:hypothetical protein DPMN_043324 [Dreissena polymorpha]|uniref:Uncharacterized protein n=1 Tax=Dreissena polymorpha TaxID=45954 RepID=A0A9D4HZI9_DREPO|nr:hypothetical protein DPMN_043324 [Dreissena polymorpha]